MKRAKKKDYNPEQIKRTLSIIIIGVGAMIWLFSDIDDAVFQSMIKLSGIFLFVLGLISLGKSDRILTKKERAKRIMHWVILFFILLIGTLIFFFIYGFS